MTRCSFLETISKLIVPRCCFKLWTHFGGSMHFRLDWCTLHPFNPNPHSWRKLHSQFSYSAFMQSGLWNLNIYIYTPLQPSDPLYSFLFAVFLLCVVFTRGLTLAPSQQCYWHGDIMHLHTTSAKNRDSITQRPSVQGREQVTVNGDPSSDRLKSWRSWQM